MGLIAFGSDGHGDGNSPREEPSRVEVPAERDEPPSLTPPYVYFDASLGGLVDVLPAETVRFVEERHPEVLQRSALWFEEWRRVDGPIAPDERIFPTAPSGDNAMDVTDLLTTLWLRLVAACGIARGVVDPACFEGLREHGYVSHVSRG